ncbi:MAG TPA: hypothetical protein PKC21_07240 [Oligoflexia bacterium]|nr:hypothetical protein [Oligoflexia bacterium]HMR25132.1 hypothetical protein [Oligoflexia bacterium]
MSLHTILQQSFNEKNAYLFSSLFHDNIVGINLHDDLTAFSSKTELLKITHNLFKINPDLSCQITQHYTLDPFFILHLYFSNYVCGATRNTIWTCKIENDLISKLWFTH